MLTILLAFLAGFVSCALLGYAVMGAIGNSAADDSVDPLVLPQ